jgi:hypothetical protein
MTSFPDWGSQFVGQIVVISYWMPKKIDGIPASFLQVNDWAQVAEEAGTLF